MKPTSYLSFLFAALVVSTTSGCALLSKGRNQTVVVNSNPPGATAYINGEEIGKTPLNVTLKRSSSYSIELRKPGFVNATTAVLPVQNEYARRYFRWGIDVALGSTTDLTPADVVVELSPVEPPTASGDRYQEIAQRILRADALLAAKEISAADHKHLVSEILKSNPN